MLKLLVKIIAVILILIVLAGLVLLLPAHLAIREIRPPLPADEELLALSSNNDSPTHASYILTSSQQAPGRSIGHHSIVLEWADGKTFIIDAGMDVPHAQEFGDLLEVMWGAGPADVHTTLVEALKGKSLNVRGVGFTHLHIDHTQGVAAFCAAPNSAQVFQTQTQRNIHNSNTSEGATIVSACAQNPAIDGDTLTPVPGFPGLAMFTLGGHTPGSTLFAAAVNGQVLLFSGDITNSKNDLLNNQPKAWWYSYLVVPEDVDRTAQLRAWLQRLDAQPKYTVVVSHDLNNVAQTLPAFGE